MEASLTLESTSEVSLANCKTLSIRSSPEVRYLPARVDSDRTIENSSMEFDMGGILVVLLALFALVSSHVGLVEEPD